VRRRVPDPDFIICVKINSVEFRAGGTTPDDCKNLCIMLEKARVDFVDLSGGTFEGRAFEHKKESTVSLPFLVITEYPISLVAVMARWHAKPTSSNSPR
jgi:2,4-dienoyl-CoA reductase-like NADH-dependent reductase (Old Yellow Enzyme family)